LVEVRVRWEKKTGFDGESVRTRADEIEPKKEKRKKKFCGKKAGFELTEALRGWLGY